MDVPCYRYKTFCPNAVYVAVRAIVVRMDVPEQRADQDASPELKSIS